MASPVDLRLDGVAADRFWAKVRKADGCWEWTAYRGTGGYGEFALSGRKVAAHRIAYVATYGEIPAGMIIDHACRNRACVNPEHLRPVTYKQNAENLSGARPESLAGFRGVNYNAKAGKWQASVRHNYKRYYCGLFERPEDAAEAARALRLALHSHNELDRSVR